MSRTIVETKPGIYVDPATKRRTSQKDGDKVVSKEQWEQAHPDAEESKDKPLPETTILSTGKVTIGPTTEITCAKKGCNEKRVIKKQDKFQVRYCILHQKERRNELRRNRRKGKDKGQPKS